MNHRRGRSGRPVGGRGAGQQSPANDEIMESGPFIGSRHKQGGRISG